MTLLDAYVEGKPVVIYDTREKRTFVIRYLKEFKDITLVEKQLEIADYLVQSAKGTIAIERKTATDFLNSISDGRIFEQIEALKEYDDARIILEGGIFTHAKMKICYTIDSIGKALNAKFKSRTQPRTVWATRFFVNPHALTAIFGKIQEEGIKIIPSGSTYDTADLLRFWATYAEEREKQILIRNKPKTEDEFTNQVFAVAGLPGIGSKQAELLLKTFGTPMHVFSAFLSYDPKKFPVDGIAEIKIKKIKEVLTKNLSEAHEKTVLEHEIRERINELSNLMRRREIELEKMSMKELKPLLKERKLKLGGKRDELVQRLLGSLEPWEKADIDSFVKKYEELLKIKSDMQTSDSYTPWVIPEETEKFYKKVKNLAGLHRYNSNG